MDQFQFGSFASALFQVCVVFRSVWFDSDLFGSFPIRACVILIYVKYRHHFRKINIGTIRVYLGLSLIRIISFRIRFGYKSGHLIWIIQFKSFLPYLLINELF